MDLLVALNWKYQLSLEGISGLFEKNIYINFLFALQIGNSSIFEENKTYQTLQ